MGKKLFNDELVFMNHKVKNKQSALEELVENLYKGKFIKNREDFLDSIVKRENIFSTGIGNGLAIPHCRSKNVEKFTVAVLIPQTPLEFDSMDHKPVNVIFMLAVPEKEADLYKDFLKSVSIFFRNKEKRETIINSKGKEELLKILKEIENDIK